MILIPFYYYYKMVPNAKDILCYFSEMDSYVAKQYICENNLAEDINKNICLNYLIYRLISQSQVKKTIW